MLKISRRELLAAGSLVSLSSFTPRFLLESAAWGSEHKGDNVLVVVQLTGGNDGLNTVIPYRHERYSAARPSLAIGPSQVLKIDADTGLHPNLKGLMKLLEERRLAIMQGVGYPNPNRSHFESMDIWHTARTEATRREAGWLGRALDSQRASLLRSPDPAAIHLGEEVQPLALAAREVPSPSIRSLDHFRLDTSGSESQRAAIHAATIAPRDTMSDLLRFVQTQATSALDISQRLERSAQSYKSSVSYPDTALARKLRNVARLIDAGLSTRVYYVSLDGFDTHSEQAVVHNGLMSQLGDALAAFSEDLAAHAQQDRVLTLVFSEFGRRVQENASRGTDHGAAAPLFLVGSKIKTGLIGQHPNFNDLDDGDLKFHTDFRSIYAALLDNWLRWPSGDILGKEFAAAKIWG